MKQVVSFRNRMVVSAVLAAFFFTTSSFTFSPAVEAPLADDPPQKREQRVKVIVRKDGKETKIDTTFNFPDEKFDFLNQQGDSGMKKRVRKIVHIGEDDEVITFGSPEDNELPPPPPPPPVPPFLWNRPFVGDPFAFDTNDESIISYDKKDIGKGLERITIIRKKKAGQKENKEVQVRLETSDDSKK